MGAARTKELYRNTSKAQRGACRRLCENDPKAKSVHCNWECLDSTACCLAPVLSCDGAALTLCCRVMVLLAMVLSCD
eukprot:scaffold5416_cov17-Tisochrysis_lutea.AAC.1